MELKKITYFLRIAQEGSLSKAAASLYLTQPTLSRFLDKLEDELGVKLFIRSRSSALELTPAGQAYLNTARQIDRLCRSLEEELAAGQSRNTIRFGINGDHLQDFAADCARKVMQHYPQVSVRFFCDSALELQRLVAEGELELALCAFAHRDPRLTYRLCRKSEMNLVVAKDHPLACHSYQLPGQQEHRIRLDQLDPDAPFALMRDHTVLRQTAEQYLHRMSYTPNIKRTYMRHGSIANILTGDEPLIGFCPADNCSQRLAYLAPDPPFYYSQGICFAKNTLLTPAETFLIRLLKDFPAQRQLD